MIEAVGAKVLCPHTLPILTQSSYGGHNSNLFTEFCAPTTTEMIDKLISVALDLINHQHLKTGLLIAVVVPHGKCCNALHRLVCSLKTAALIPQGFGSIHSDWKVLLKRQWYSPILPDFLGGHEHFLSFLVTAVLCPQTAASGLAPGHCLTACAGFPDCL